MPDLPTMLRGLAGELLQSAWLQMTRFGAIGPQHRRGRRFGHLGDGAAICFPVAALFGERWMHVGSGTIIGPYATLSAGIAPDHVPEHSPVVHIGERCVIGKGSGIVGHASVVVGDDVWTGHHVYVTDANHGYEDVAVAPGRQLAAPRPVTIGDRAWLGHGAIVLPGSVIGTHAVIGAGSVVAGEIPAFSVAVGNPARVIRRHVAGRGWQQVDDRA